MSSSFDPRDQFADDIDTPYPLFGRPKQYPPVDTDKYEDKYQHEQQMIPAYYPCRCRHCSMARDLAPQPRPPMRTKTIDERVRDIAGPCEDFTVGPIGDPMIIVLIFLVVMVACMCYSIATLSAQIDILKQLINKT